MSMASEVANQRIRSIEGVSDVLDDAEKQVASIISDRIVQELTQKQFNVMKWLQLKWTMTGVLAGAVSVIGFTIISSWLNPPAYVQAFSGSAHEQFIGVIAACNEPQNKAGAIIGCKTQLNGILNVLPVKKLAMEGTRNAAE